ncbi:UNC93-like protein MFSD11 [Homalodisca vitripennis]|uniref:UNC93-like protein MFSD11 n=1 Tax=Homalodisca vitripennis TaxID=197043 RepID=UPI001EEAD093|nr:UNC93-like protein MFSD11 [Homalodisca vitripennis]
MFIPINREIVCILSLSFSVMLLFSSDLTVINMQKTIVSSISDDTPEVEVDGYTVTAVAYSLFAVSLLLGPYLSHAIGPKLTMIVSAFAYLSATVPYLVENGWMIFGGAIINGIAAGFMYPAQGQYLIENSSPQTAARNVGIFWTMFRASTLWGNLFVYYIFYGKQYIDQYTRRTVLYFFMGINLLAIASLMILPKSSSDCKTEGYSPSKTVKTCWAILKSRKMLWLMFSFSYAGLQQAFGDGVYSITIGYTMALGNSAKELVAVSGIIMSIGGLIGGVCIIVFATRIRRHRYARRSIFMIGCTSQVLAYLITFINLPDTAVFGNTDQLSLINPSATLALTGSLLLTFGDSCLNTQIYSIIAELFRESSAEACAFYSFFKAVCIATSFYWCNHIGLQVQLVILTVMALIGAFCFLVADNDIATSICESKTATQDTEASQR